MSNNKQDKGKLYHKLHHLQKMVTRLLKLGKKDKMIEVQEKHLIEKIKGKPKKEIKWTNNY